MQWRWDNKYKIEVISLCSLNLYYLSKDNCVITEAIMPPQNTFLNAYISVVALVTMQNCSLRATDELPSELLILSSCTRVIRPWHLLFLIRQGWIYTYFGFKFHFWGIKVWGNCLPCMNGLFKQFLVVLSW